MSPKERRDQALTAIYQALIALIQTQAMATISVTKLCKEAGVSRTYYYKHFTTHTQIIDQYEMLSVVTYMRGLPNNTRLAMPTMMAHYFELAAVNREAQLVLFETGNEQPLIRGFETAFQYLLKLDKINQNPGSYTTRPYWGEFLAGAVINTSLRWLQNGMVESPAYMGQLVADFLKIQRTQKRETH